MEGTRGKYDATGELEYLTAATKEVGEQGTVGTGKTCGVTEIEIPLHGGDWMELDRAIGCGGLEPLDVSTTSRDELVHQWHELRDIKYVSAMFVGLMSCFDF